MKLTNPLRGIVALLMIALTWTACNRFPDRFGGLWLVPTPQRTYILVFSSQMIPGKASSTDYNIVLLDPFSGHRLASKTLNLKYGMVHLHCFTGNNLWLNRNGKIMCLEFPSLKVKWRQDKLLRQIERSHPEIGKIHKAVLNFENIEIISNTGESFQVNLMEFENTSILPMPFYLGEYTQAWRLSEYPYPLSGNENKITITLESDNDPPANTTGMTLPQVLEADNGYARNYAVFTRDGECLLFDGNLRRSMLKLTDYRNGLAWQPIAENQVWLEGDFLRPHKSFRDVPTNRCIIHQDSIAYIHYQTSLEPGENRLHIAAININSGEILWDTELAAYGIDHGYQPLQNFIFVNSLISVWKNDSDRFRIISVNIADGKILWKR